MRKDMTPRVRIFHCLYCVVLWCFEGNSKLVYVHRIMHHVMFALHRPWLNNFKPQRGHIIR